ncbi:hypothetical protein SEA_KEANU_77 [Streptomyces phage Keanu]|nr:hypothetical protein SEA_KEANU_77 [Streptomyces phage Keanu]
MITILVGSAVVWGAATVAFDNWQAGLVLAVLTFFGTLGGMRRRREELDREERAQVARDLVTALREEQGTRRRFWR